MHTIQSATTVWQLLLALKKLGTIQGSDKMYSSDELIIKVLEVLSSSGQYALNSITRAEGLRDKVVELQQVEVRPWIDWFLIWGTGYFPEGDRRNGTQPYNDWPIEEEKFRHVTREEALEWSGTCVEMNHPGYGTFLMPYVDRWLEGI